MRAHHLATDSDVLPPELHLVSDPQVQLAAERCDRAASRLRYALDELEHIQLEWRAINRLRDILDRSRLPSAQAALEAAELSPRLEESDRGVRRVRRYVLRAFEVELSDAAREYREALSHAAKQYQADLAVRRRELQAMIAVEPERRAELSDAMVGVEMAALGCEVYRAPTTRLTLRGRPSEVLEQALHPVPGVAFPLAEILDQLDPYLTAERDDALVLVNVTAWTDGRDAGRVEVRAVCGRGVVPSSDRSDEPNATDVSDGAGSKLSIAG